MGLLSELLDEEKKTIEPTAAPAAENRSASVAAIPVAVAMAATEVLPAEVLPIAQPGIPHPCRTCGSYLAWESIYRDGTLRCDRCEPAPSPAMIGGWWGLVEHPRDTLGESRFAWAPVVFEEAERREQLKTDRYGAGGSRGASGTPQPVFNPTDAAIASLGESVAVAGTADGEPVTPTTFAPRWSPPDADGWCWGVDVDGTTHMRRARFVRDGPAAMGQGLAWLTETEAEWRARMAVVDEVVGAGGA